MKENKKIAEEIEKQVRIHYNITSDKKNNKDIKKDQKENKE